jgi:small conductance mechanosensitive channel
VRNERQRWLLFPLLLLAVCGFAGAAQEPPADEAQKTELDEGQALVQAIARSRAETAELQAEVDKAEGEDLRVAEKRLRDQRIESLREFETLVEYVTKQEKSGVEVAEERELAEETLDTALPGIQGLEDEIRADLQQLRAARESTDPADLLDLEAEISADALGVDLLLEVLFDVVEWKERLGLDPAAERAYLVDRTTERAERLSARVELGLEEAADLHGRSADDPDDTQLQDQLRAVDARLANGTESLSNVIDVRKGLDLPSAEYRELLIRATGKVTTDVLNTDVALSLLDTMAHRVGAWWKDNGPALLFNLFLFLLILFLFWVLAGVARRVAKRSLASARVNVSRLLADTVIRFVYNAVLVLGLLIGLSQMGVSLAPLLAGLGVLGFIVGFALQDTLGNFASGMMILLYRPFDVGDQVEVAGISGNVRSMSLVSTTILTFDHQTIIVPNNKVWGDVIKNVTAQRKRRVDMVFGISYDDDIPKAESLLKAILDEHDKVVDDPPPMIRLHELGASSVDFIVRPWALTDDYWEVYWDVTREVKMRFDREGISIPFPQRDVHMHSAG